MEHVISTEPARCPLCGSGMCNYEGHDDDDIYTCRECGEMFSYENPLYT